jgi:hypothetical protein
MDDTFSIAQQITDFLFSNGWLAGDIFTEGGVTELEITNEIKGILDENNT